MKPAIKKHIVVIGAGFAGLSSAAYLAQAGYKVTVLEKNNQPGGRAYTVKRKGFRFELGPSWYMMPDVFEEFFADFGSSVKDYYKLSRLDPSYRVFFNGGQQYDLGSAADNQALFSKLEPGASVELEKLLKKSADRYRVSRQLFLDQDYGALPTLLSPRRVAALRHLPLFKNYHQLISRQFNDYRLQQILAFMTVFLGSTPRTTPAMYSLLVHVDMNLGIWYPAGGFTKLAQSFVKHAKKQGAVIEYKNSVSSIEVDNGSVRAVRVGRRRIACDAVVAATDYQHVESQLLSEKYRSYSRRYWSSRQLSPTAILISLGIDTPLSNLEHHNLFFDANWRDSFRKLHNKKINTEPLFYVSIASKTDRKVAPAGMETLFILIPQPAGTVIDKATLETIKQNVYQRIGERAQLDLVKHIVAEDVRTQTYFAEMFNAFKGNAFGLSHSLRQSAFLRPKNQSKKVANLFYAGQYTNPGTGVPLAVLSGKLVSRLVKKTII